MPSYPTHFHDCAISIYVSILYDVLDHVPSFLCVRSATISYSSTYTLSSRNKSQNSIFHRRPTPWHATYSPQFFNIGRAGPSAIHIFLAILHVLVWYSTHDSSFCLFRRNNRVIVLVSHPLIFPLSAASTTSFHFQK